MNWTFLQELNKFISEPNVQVMQTAGQILRLEVCRLAKQKCAYCDGYGHAGNDCPTDFKLTQLRAGVREQAKLVQELRAECRVAAGMANVTGFSLLPAKPRTRYQVRKMAEESESGSLKFAGRSFKK